MKKNIHWFIVSGMLLVASACTDENKDPVNEGEEPVVIEKFSLTLNEQEGNLPTKAVSDYAVNDEYADPTATLAGRDTWTLHVEIYKGNAVYTPYGIADFSFNTTTEWVPDTDIHFPNYTTQQASLIMYPDTPTTPIDTDQSAPDGSALFQQDILEQNGNGTINLVPAHIPEAPLRHARSMLDFRLRNVNDLDISEVTVEVGGVEYKPYQVADGNYPEYMVIIPVASAAPIIRVYTNGGAQYQQTTVDKITGTVANHCYCFILSGLELRLAEITIAEWTTGVGILGEYTIEQSYPTFRGPADATATLFYDNGLSQEVIFNDQGEVTDRPVGRRLIRVQSDRATTQVDIVLSGMVIDLSMYI